MAGRLFEVRVKPQSKDRALVQGEDGIWQARLKAPPVDGRANAELVDLFAEHFGCPRSAVQIRGGATGRRKWVRIEDGA